MSIIYLIGGPADLQKHNVSGQPYEYFVAIPVPYNHVFDRTDPKLESINAYPRAVYTRLGVTSHGAIYEWVRNE